MQQQMPVQMVILIISHKNKKHNLIPLCKGCHAQTFMVIYTLAWKLEGYIRF